MLRVILTVLNLKYADTERDSIHVFRVVTSCLSLNNHVTEDVCVLREIIYCPKFRTAMT